MPKTARFTGGYLQNDLHRVDLTELPPACDYPSPQGVWIISQINEV